MTTHANNKSGVGDGAIQKLRGQDEVGRWSKKSALFVQDQFKKYLCRGKEVLVRLGLGDCHDSGLAKNSLCRGE